MFNFMHPHMLSFELVCFWNLDISEESMVLYILWDVKAQRRRTGLKLHTKICLGGIGWKLSRINMCSIWEKKLASEIHLSVRLFSERSKRNFSVHGHLKGIWIKGGLCWTVQRNGFRLHLILPLDNDMKYGDFACKYMGQPKACSLLCLAGRSASIKPSSFKEGAMLSAHLSWGREGSTEGGGLLFINCIILSFQADKYLRQPKGGDF